MHHTYIGFIGLLSVCWPVALSSEKDTLRVYNGEKATPGQFPYQIALRASSETKPGKSKLYHTFCGGAVIGVRKILSAAHCFYTRNQNAFAKLWGAQYVRKSFDIYAVAGTLRSVVRYPSILRQRPPQQWRELSDVLIPPDYKFPKKDIALAFTKVSFEFNHFVGSLPYATQEMDYGHMTCLVSGFGRISKTTTSKTLMWAYLELIPSKDCSIKHGRQMRNFICTESSVTSVLKGDSGGPLVCKNTGDSADTGIGVIVGVVSGVRTKGGIFFTRVSSFKQFIESSKATTSTPDGLCASIVFFTLLTMSFSFVSANWINNKNIYRESIITG